MKNFDILGVYWKIRFLRGGGGLTKNQYRRGNFLKKGGGAWTVCRFKGGLDKKEGVVRGVWHPDAHYA